MFTESSIFRDLLQLLPPEDDKLLTNLSTVISGDKILVHILNQIKKLEKNYLEKSEKLEEDVKNSLEMLNVLIDYLHENLHMGEWHSVDVKLRKSYSVSCFFKVLLSIYESCDAETLDECAFIIDMAIMLGDRLVNDEEEEILQRAATLISASNAEFKKQLSHDTIKRLIINDKVNLNCRCDIDKVDRPSIEYFLENHFKVQKPILITNAIEHWPAMERWRDLDYLLTKAGSRTVPVELGSKYTSDNWSQSLVKFSEFIEHCILNPKDEEDVAYLAQHDLFDQITELKDDIVVPEYICQTDQEPRIKAWLGPKGTVSPLHTDPTHNLLCQVFGQKRIILAAPEDTKNLYPHDHFILNNTSQVDFENIDTEKFPLTKLVKFYDVTLQRGDILYLPPKWWHFVRSLSPSFSVSFWFE